MGYSTKPGSAALPKPHSTPSPSLADFGGAFANTGGAVGDTQVVAQGPNLISWIGTSADAYTAESLDIQDRAVQLQGVLATIDGELESYGEIFQTLADTTIPNYQEQWDEAITTHDENVEATRGEMETARAQTPPDETFDDSSYHAEIRRQGELLEETQDELARLYNSAVCDVDDAAATTATNISAALDSYVPRGTDGGLPSRAAIGGALFGDNGGILGAQQHMEQGVEDAADANEILSDVDENGFPTEAAMQEFNDKYGDRMAHDPFFATAFYEEFGIDRLNSMLGMTSGGYHMGVGPEYEELVEETLSNFGAGLVLATGGENPVPDSALSLDGGMGELARERRAVWDAWQATDSGAMFNLGDTQGLDAWRSQFQSEMIDAGRDTWDVAGNRIDGYGSGAAGYAGMMQIINLGTQNDPGLSLGDSFLNGPNSVAHDLVAWDEEAGLMWDSNVINPHDVLFTNDSIGIDPVQNMLEAMNGRGEPAQTFLASDTSFTFDHDDDRDSDDVSMNMTRFLVGHRHLSLDGQNWMDGGDALGELLNDATWNDPHSEASTTIALNFMEGYTDGLAEDRDTWLSPGNLDRVNGEDVFGHKNSGLRSWAGYILDDYMADIADGMVTPSSTTGVVPGMDGEGYKLVINDALRDQLIGNGADSMFIDLAFDSPEQNEDGTWVGGRPPALNTLIDRSLIEMNLDLVNAMGEGGSDGMIHDANSSWSAVLEHLTTSEAGMDHEVAAALDERNSYLQGLINKGVGAIPFSEILTESGHKYVHGQVKNLGLLDMGLEAILPTDGAAQATVEQVGAHNAVEVLVREQFYSAISQNTYWEGGADPFDTFGPDGDFGRYDMIDDDGQLIPYFEMTEDQRLLFEQWVMDYEYGAGERFDEHIHDIEGNLNDAQQEGNEG